MKMIKSVSIKNKYVQMYETNQNVLSIDKTTSLNLPMFFVRAKGEKTFSEKYVYKRQEANEWFDILTQTII